MSPRNQLMNNNPIKLKTWKTTDEERIPLTSSLKLKESKEKKHDQPNKNEAKETFLKNTIVVASIVSIILNLIMSVAAFIIAALRDSAATYAFGADCLLDLVSSAILLWRFCGKEDALALKRERRACIILGVFFVTSAVAVIIKAAMDLVQEDSPVTFRALYILAISGTVTCLLMALAKVILAKKVDSASLMLDAVNSVISGTLAFVIILSDIVYNSNNDIWYIEPMMSIVLSALLIIYGIKVIYDQRSNPSGSQIISP